MRYSRHLMLLLWLMIGSSVSAQFNPTNPEEPGARPWRLTLKANPEKASSFNQSRETYHQAGEVIALMAYDNNGHEFKSWEDEQGNILSNEAMLYYTMPARHVTLTARYQYNPSTPSEPGPASISRHLRLEASPNGSGYFSHNANTDIVAGQQIYLEAYPNTHYSFVNWSKDGEVISTSRGFTYTMPDRDATLTAHFDYHYSPDSPDEPGTAQDARCNLYGMREGVLPGQTHTYYIYMENPGTEVTGFSVEVAVPEGFGIDTRAIALATRAEGHTLNAEPTASGVRLEVSGATAITGVSGSVAEIPISVPATVSTGSIFPVRLSNGQAFKTDGTQVAIKVRSGSLQVVKAAGDKTDSPDYTVGHIATTSGNVMPGEVIHLSWQVSNEGRIAGSGGWTERIYLTTPEGRKVSIGTTTYDTQTLEPGATVSRSADIALALLPGIEGKAGLGVTIVPGAGSGETDDLLANNSSQTSGTPLTIGKCLYLTLPQAPQLEGVRNRVSCQLSRSGDWTTSETFQLIKVSGDERTILPATVTIPRNQASVYFYPTLNNNAVCDADSIVSLRVEALNGYAAIEGSYIVRDDELPPLRASLSSSEVTEGDSLTLTISRPTAGNTDLTVGISSEHPKKFRHPGTATIAAGQTETTVGINVVDDELPDTDVAAAFHVSAGGYEPAEALVIVKDNDMPVLELTLSPNKVKEGDGPVSVTATLTRKTNQDKQITVRLSSDGGSRLYLPLSEVQMAKGVEQATFNLGPVDNTQVDGDHTYTLNAAVWLSSCSCSASGHAAGSVEARLTVYDDDGPALALSTSQSTVREGVTTRLTISRNTDTTLPLTVRISSDSDELLTYNHTVVIAAGQQTATVEVTPAANSVTGDTKTIVFTAEAEGYSGGTCWLMVTDQTLPDARIRSLASSKTAAEVGTEVTLTAEVENRGMAALRDATPINVYRQGESAPIARLYTRGETAPGESQTVSQTLTLPTTVGEHTYYAVVNEEHRLKELNYTNNTSASITVKALAPFQVQISTDKNGYRQGSTVAISGQLTGRGTANAEVDVYLANEGSREVRRLTTDGNGQFATDWQLKPLQAGHFAVGACYPEEQTSEEMAAFEVYGLKRTENGYITCEVTVGEPLTGQIHLQNICSSTLTGVKAEAVALPEGCKATLNIPATIGGNQTVSLNYSLSSSKASTTREWSLMKARISSNEGTLLEVPLYYYSQQKEAKLETATEQLTLSITKGTSRDIPLKVTNTGRGETGVITVALTEGFSMASGSSSLKQGEETTLLLRFTPTERMQLNVPMKGTLGVNCPNGKGLTIPFEMTLVSEEKGVLEVDACDEYTYNTTEAPHVEGATVTVRHPATNEILAVGRTGKDGRYSVELTEGYYRLEVEAEKHEKYANYVLVNPGATERVTVNIGYQPISVSWNVEETEVEDEYRIETNVQYETNVPMPVVKIDMPKRIDGDNMAVGDAVIISVKLINLGLIRADEVTLILPQDMEEWEFEPLASIDPFPLMPKDSVIIPVRITRIADVSQQGNARKKNAAETFVNGMFETYGNCDAFIRERHKENCGVDIKTNEAAEELGMKFCASVATMSGLYAVLAQILGGGPGFPGGVYAGGGGGGGATYGEVQQTLNICDPCVAKKVNDGLDKAIGATAAGPIWDGIGNAAKQAQKERDERDKKAKEDGNGGNGGDGGNGGNKGGGGGPGQLAGDIAQNAAEDFADMASDGKIGMVSDAIDIASMALPCDDKVYDKMIKQSARSRHAQQRGWEVVFEETANHYARHLLRTDSLLMYAFGDRIWYEEADMEKWAFVDYALALPRDYTPTDEELMAHKPASASVEDLRALIDHIDGKGPNSPTQEQIDMLVDSVVADYGYAQTKGYDNMARLFDEAYADYRRNLEEMASQSVCATISLSLESSMTMTRQAFRGRLKVFNGHEDTAMKDMRVNLLVRDMQGRAATTREFQISTESKDGFTGTDGLTDGWTLNAQDTGTATILFIPSKHAAPTEPQQYSFGGTLTYIDPFTDLEVTRNLYPVVMTVNPSPELDLTYFMQRDIYADDPLTEEVETQQPAEFALLINNKGYGDATNVRLVTQQPQITENEKGLLIDFKIESSQVNGEPAALAFGQEIANDFGTIAGQSQAYAQWWLTSTLLGHFTNYDVKATHVTSYGNEDLSLLDEVTIHELIHGFTRSEGGRGFLVNDIIDAEDLPDMVYFTDASQKSVGRGSADISKISTTDYLLKVSPTTAGWTYASVPDPTAGKQRPVTLRRQSDGKELPCDNVWQTWCTLRDGKDPVYENRLHFIGNVTAEGEAYLLSFEPLKPSDPNDDPNGSGIAQVMADGQPNVRISPQPMGDRMRISGNFKTINKLRLYSLNGWRLLERQQLLPDSDVDVSRLKPGVYIVTIQTDLGTYRAKIVKE